MTQVCSSATGVVFKAEYDWVMRLADVRLGVGTYLRDRWRMWGNLLIWHPTPRPLRQGVSARFPNMKPRTCFFLSWHLSPCLSILLETPPSNCQLHLRLSSKCFSPGMVFTRIPRFSRSCGGTLSPDFKVKKLAFLQTWRERTEKKDYELLSVISVPTFPPRSFLVTFALPHLVQGQRREAGDASETGSCGSNSTRFSTETLKIKQSLSRFCWMSRAVPQEPQTSTKSYLNRCQTGPRLQTPQDKLFTLTQSQTLNTSSSIFIYFIWGCFVFLIMIEASDFRTWRLGPVRPPRRTRTEIAWKSFLCLWLKMN